MKRPITAFRSSRRALLGALGLLVVFAAHACKQGGEASSLGEPADAKAGRITFLAPTPTPIEIFWIDSAGNLGLRGVEAVVPGLPTGDGKLPPTCRESATANGNGTLTVCMSPTVGRVLAEKLGLWTLGKP